MAFAKGLTFLLIISPLECAILLQHVKCLQLFHNVVTLGNPLLCLFWGQVLVPQECSMTAIPEICVTLRVLLAQVEQGPVQSHHPHSLAGHCQAGGNLVPNSLLRKKTFLQINITASHVRMQPGSNSIWD